MVNASSNGHKIGVMDFDNLMNEGGKDYSAQEAYGCSKLANILFTYELERRFELHDADAIAVATHPGGSNTSLGDHIPAVRLFRSVLGLVNQSAAMGALTTLRASSSRCNCRWSSSCGLGGLSTLQTFFSPCA